MTAEAWPIYSKVNCMIDERIDRGYLKVTSFDEAEADDVDYWMSKSPAERIESLEYLRRWVYGDAAVDANTAGASTREP